MRTDFNDEYMQVYGALSRSAKEIVRSKNKALNQFLIEKEHNSKESQKHKEDQNSANTLITIAFFVITFIVLAKSQVELNIKIRRVL